MERIINLILLAIALTIIIVDIFHEMGFIILAAIIILGVLIDSSLKNAKIKDLKLIKPTYKASSASQFLRTYGDLGIALVQIAVKVVKADRKYYNAEVEFVRRFLYHFLLFKTENAYQFDFKNQYYDYEEPGIESGMRLFDIIFKEQDTSLQPYLDYLADDLMIDQKLELLHFLFRLAIVNKKMDERELALIHSIAQGIKIPEEEYSKVKSNYVKEQKQSSWKASTQRSLYRYEKAFKTLQTPLTSNKEQVKKAYRTLAKVHHPDRFATQSETVRKQHQQLFQEILEAYEYLKKIGKAS